MIKKYEDFCNEEMNLRKIAATGLLATTLATTSCSDKIGVSPQDTETVDNSTFTEYQVTTQGWGKTLTFNISKHNIIGTRWSTRSGKSTITHYTITVPQGTEQIHYNTSFWGGEIYSDTEMNNNRIIKLSDLEVVIDTDTYTILESPKWFQTVDYLMVNKGYSDAKNSFTTDGGNFTYLKYDGDYFVVPQ